MTYKLIISILLITLGTLISGSGTLITSGQKSIPKSSISQIAKTTLRNDSVGTDESEPLQIVKSYVDFSQKGEFAKLKDITINSILVRKYLDGAETNNSKDRNNSNRQSSKEIEIIKPDISPLDEYDYKLLVFETPSLIKKTQLKIKDYSIKLLNDRQCRIEITLGNEEGNRTLINDFYLYNLENKNWKIYKVGFPKGLKD